MSSRVILLHHTTTTVAVLGFIVGIFWTVEGVSGAVSRLQRGRWRRQLADGHLGLIATIIGILFLVYASLSLSIICVIVGDSE